MSARSRRSWRARSARLSSRSVSVRAGALSVDAIVLGLAGRRLDDVVGRVVRRGDRTETAGLVILEGLEEFVLRVHDERSVPGHRLADRPPAEEEHLQRG